MAKNKAPPKTPRKKVRQKPKSKKTTPSKRKRKKNSPQAPRWCLQIIRCILEKTMSNPQTPSDQEQNALIAQLIANQDDMADTMKWILQELTDKHEKNAAAIKNQQETTTASAQALGKLTVAAKGVAEKIRALKDRLGQASQAQAQPIPPGTQANQATGQ